MSCADVALPSSAILPIAEWLLHDTLSPALSSTQPAAPERWAHDTEIHCTEHDASDELDSEWLEVRTRDKGKKKQQQKQHEAAQLVQKGASQRAGQPVSSTPTALSRVVSLTVEEEAKRLSARAILETEAIIEGHGPGHTLAGKTVCDQFPRGRWSDVYKPRLGGFTSWLKSQIAADEGCSLYIASRPGEGQEVLVGMDLHQLRRRREVLEGREEVRACVERK